MAGTKFILTVLLALILFSCGSSKPPTRPVGADIGAIVEEPIGKNNGALIIELRQLGQEVYETDRGVVINLPDVLFEFGKADLTDDAKRALGEMAEVIVTVPERRISVEGHTDSVGTVAYNQQLSEDRARSVTQVLVANGVAKKQIHTRGLGETIPLASNRRESGQKRNRRVEVVIEN